MKTVLITGASGGIGKELAEIFAGNGYNLYLVAKGKMALEDLAGELERRFPVKARFLDVDLSEISSAAFVYETVKSSGQTIDILVNNAGIGMFGEFADMPVEKVNTMLSLNIIAVTNLTRLFAEDMKKRQSGKILNVASVVGFMPFPYFASYAASKAYVLSLTEAVHKELKAYNIQVSVLCPGATSSGFAQQAKMTDTGTYRDERKLLTAKDVASIAYSGLMKGDMTIIVGMKNRLLAFLTRFVPRKQVINMTAKQMFK